VPHIALIEILMAMAFIVFQICDTVQSGACLLAFWRRMLPPCSEFYCPEDGNSIF
jgi:hypothetical protein